MRHEDDFGNPIAPLWQTIDEVVATNIRRLRVSYKPADASEHDPQGLSREALAAKLTATTGTEWSRWRIVDLEGARSQSQAPRPATWSDLVAIAIALNVTVYELVLPNDDTTRVTIAEAMQERDHGAYPATDDIPENLRGAAKTSPVGYSHKSNRDELGELLFQIPGDNLTPENLERLAKAYGSDLTAALADIADVQEGLARAVDLIESIKEQENTDGVDS